MRRWMVFCVCVLAAVMAFSTGWAKEPTIKIGINAPLVHYYFPTIDDLFVAVLQRRSGRNVERINESSNEVATGADHTARACLELSQLAASLRQTIGRFRLA